MYPTLESSTSNGQRLLVVANRLPVSAYKDKAGAWQFEVINITDNYMIYIAEGCILFEARIEKVLKLMNAGILHQNPESQ